MVRLANTVREIRTWYNYDRPHDHLQGWTLGEVWAGIDVFTTKTGYGQRDKIGSVAVETTSASGLNSYRTGGRDAQLRRKTFPFSFPLTVGVLLG
jgi:hypothetical protein